MCRMDSTEDLFSSLDDPNDEINDPYDVEFDMTQRSTPEEEGDWSNLLYSDPLNTLSLPNTLPFHS